MVSSLFGGYLNLTPHTDGFPEPYVIIIRLLICDNPSDENCLKGIIAGKNEQMKVVVEFQEFS